MTTSLDASQAHVFSAQSTRGGTRTAVTTAGATAHRQQRHHGINTRGPHLLDDSLVDSPRKSRSPRPNRSFSAPARDLVNQQSNFRLQTPDSIAATPIDLKFPKIRKHHILDDSFSSESDVSSQPNSAEMRATRERTKQFPRMLVDYATQEGIPETPSGRTNSRMEFFSQSLPRDFFTASYAKDRNESPKSRLNTADGGNQDQSQLSRGFGVSPSEIPLNFYTSLFDQEVRNVMYRPKSTISKLSKRQNRRTRSELQHILTSNQDDLRSRMLSSDDSFTESKRNASKRRKSKEVSNEQNGNTQPSTTFFTEVSIEESHGSGSMAATAEHATQKTTMQIVDRASRSPPKTAQHMEGRVASRAQSQLARYDDDDDPRALLANSMSKSKRKNKPMVKSIKTKKVILMEELDSLIEQVKTGSKPLDTSVAAGEDPLAPTKKKSTTIINRNVKQVAKLDGMTPEQIQALVVERSRRHAVHVEEVYENNFQLEVAHYQNGIQKIRENDQLFQLRMRQRNIDERAKRWLVLMRLRRATLVLSRTLQFDVEIIRKKREEDAHRKLEAMFILARNGKTMIRKWREKNTNKKLMIVRQFLSAIAYNLQIPFAMKRFKKFVLLVQRVWRKHKNRKQSANLQIVYRVRQFVMHSVTSPEPHLANSKNKVDQQKTEEDIKRSKYMIEQMSRVTDESVLEAANNFVEHKQTEFMRNFRNYKLSMKLYQQRAKKLQYQSGSNSQHQGNNKRQTQSSLELNQKPLPPKIWRVSDITDRDLMSLVDESIRIAARAKK